MPRINLLDVYRSGTHSRILLRREAHDIALLPLLFCCCVPCIVLFMFPSVAPPLATVVQRFFAGLRVASPPFRPLRLH